jgi:hypothetical protein
MCEFDFRSAQFMGTAIRGYIAVVTLMPPGAISIANDIRQFDSIVIDDDIANSSISLHFV